MSRLEMAGEHGPESYTCPKHTSVLSNEPHKAQNPWSTWDETRTLRAGGLCGGHTLATNLCPWARHLAPPSLFPHLQNTHQPQQGMCED